jgi:hypothetical protein
MWTIIGDKMGLGWREIEAMHWSLGEYEIARRGLVDTGKLDSGLDQSRNMLARLYKQ